MQEIRRDNFIGMVPDGVDAMLVMLHGYGSNELDLMGLAPRYIKAFPKLACFSLAAPLENENPELAATGGRQWFTLADYRPWDKEFDFDAHLDGFVRFTAANFPYIGERMKEISDLCSIPEQKTILLGFSQGAGQAVSYAFCSGADVMGAVSFSGLATIAAKDIKRRPPILMVHGLDDTIVPIDFDRRGRDLLDLAGVECEFIALPGLAHAIDDRGIEASEQFMGKLLGVQPLR